MAEITEKIEMFSSKIFDFDGVNSFDTRNIGSHFDVTSKCLKDQSNSPLQENSDNEEENGSLDNLRRSNIKKMAAIINSLRNSELEKQFRSTICTSQPVICQTKKVQNQTDLSMCSKIKIAAEPRKSARLRNMIPTFEDDFSNRQKSVRSLYCKRPYYQENLKTLYFKAPNYKIEDSVRENQGRVGLSFRKFRSCRKEEERVIIPVEEVTQAMLNNIAVRVKDKIYSQSGTTCHQCRQKTLDQKTCCRNSVCVGIQGMFCGVCIKNRYGENCADALLNPSWICPVCRGKCNCSICRNKQGKRPTGVLTPLAHYLGYESVDHFLTEKKGEGDRPEEDYKWAFTRDPEAVLGFSDGGRKVHLENGETRTMSCRPCSITDCDNSDNLLGFSNEGKYAVMGGRVQEPLLFFK